MKKINKIKKELPTQKSPVMLQLQRRHTIMEGGDPDDVWDSRKPFSRSNSACSVDKKDLKAKNFSPDSSATFSNASTVVITESELSSSWLYKNKKEQMNNNVSDPKDQVESNKEENLPKVHRPRVKSTTSAHDRSKRFSCWCYALTILAICLASLAILAGIASVFYMELFTGYDNTTNETLDPKDQKSTSGFEPMRKVGQSIDDKLLVDITLPSLPSGQENDQEITHGHSVLPPNLLPVNKLSDSSSHRRHPNINPETGVEDGALKIDIATTNEPKRLQIPNLIPNVVSFFVDSFIPKDRDNKTGETPNDEQKQNVLLPINNFLFNKNGNSPYSKLFEFYNNFHKTNSGTPKPISDGDDRGDPKPEVGENFDTDSDKLQEVNTYDITSSVDKNVEISKEQQIVNLGVSTITEDNLDKQNMNINSDININPNIMINHVFDEKKNIDSGDVVVDNISDSDLKQNSEFESNDLNQFEENNSSFDQVNKHESKSEDQVEDQINLNSKSELKMEINDTQTNFFDIESVKSLFLKPKVEDLGEIDDSDNKKSSKETPDVAVTNNENELMEVNVEMKNKDSDTFENSKEAIDDDDAVLEMHPLKPSDFEDLDSSSNHHENEKPFDNELEIDQTEMPEEEITELSNLFKNMDQNLDLDNDLSFDSNEVEEPHLNHPIFETAVPGPFEMMKRLNMEQENRIKQSELEADPSQAESQFSLAGALERLRSLDIANILPTSRMSTKIPPTRDQPSNIEKEQGIAKEQNRYLTHLRQLFFDK